MKPYLYLFRWPQKSALGLFVLLLCWMALPSSATQTQNILQKTYQLEPGDKIKIVVENEPDFDLETKISPKGTIEFALLGTVDVANLTAKALEERLRHKLLDGYLVNPIVTVMIEKYQSYQIHGEVKNPGGYPFQAGISVSKAITMAGGFSPFANKNKITVVRKKSGIHNFSTESRLIGMDEALQPGDILNIAMAASQQESNNSLQGDYRLGPGDRIKISVENEPTLSLEIKISARINSID